jgi:hypothetical protein
MTFPNRPLFTALTAITTAALTGFLPAAGDQDQSTTGEWQSLFNGKDLTGWTPKFTGYKLGEDPKDTFQVKDGVLKVSYDNYEKWGELFGHLFYQSEFSHYILRLEYRFVGDQVAKGPGWARRNNGVMIHGQTMESMGKEQKFPDSIEVQLLGGEGDEERPTANVCTPGTQIFLNDKIDKRHCITSSSDTYTGDQWVKLELEVHGGAKIIHRVNGEEVFTYKYPQKDDGTVLTGGTISLQAESAPRRVPQYRDQRTRGHRREKRVSQRTTRIRKR